MRLPAAAHTSRPWRIHELTRDFRIEDVWALPTPGGPEDFALLIDRFAGADPSRKSPAIVRLLWAIRWKLGELLGWDAPDAGPGSGTPTLSDRLPADLREGPSGPAFESLPFRSLYLADDEWAAEIANRTMHGVLHVGWVRDERGGHRGQMAVLVRPNGWLGAAYMAAIRPFRRLIVYPSMLRQIEREWGGPGAHGRTAISPRAALNALAAGHTLWGIYAYRDQLGGIVRELPGSVGDGVFQSAHSRDARAAAFWFLFVGPLLTLIGRLYASAEAAGDREAVRAAGRTVTAISAGGLVTIPRSGFPGGIALGLWLTRRGRRRS